MNDNVILYTVQAPGHDIRLKHEPPEHFANTYWEIIDYLKWGYFVWTFPDLEDFTSGSFNVPYVDGTVVWILSVPSSEIRWAAFNLYHEGNVPTEEAFFPDPETIRALPDIPTAFVQLPIKPEWVLKTAYPGRNLLTGRAEA